MENILRDNKKWKERKSLFGDLVIERENFLNFYKICAIIRPIKYNYTIIIVSLYYKSYQCFYKRIEVENIISIPNYIEDFIKDNFKDLYELPKFIKLLDELELDYEVLFTSIFIKFLIPTKRENKGIRFRLVQPIDDIRGLTERCRCYLLDNWGIIGDSSGIRKYCREDNDASKTVHTDPIFPG